MSDMYERREAPTSLIWLSLGISIAALLLSVITLIVVSSKKSVDPFNIFGSPLTAKKGGQEASIIASLRTLSTVQEQYNNRFGSYGSLANLTAEGYIDPVLGSGRKSGYIITIKYFSPYEWECVAVPEQVGTTGDRGFYIDESGVIRFTADGSKPDDTSPALD